MIYKTSFKTDNSKTTILIRLMVGIVFLSEGIQKFLYPLERGAGRFEKIGFSNADILGNFVGSLEILCGLLIVLGFLIRYASFMLIIIMFVAIYSTKVNILIRDGFWDFLHESRVDWSMLLGSIFIFIKGAGFWSLDKKLIKT
jgi:putative oxidoreductase